MFWFNMVAYTLGFGLPIHKGQNNDESMRGGMMPEDSSDPHPSFIGVFALEFWLCIL
jgi:hypothetical protein